MALTVALILAALAAIHVYWGIGGMAGPSVAVPEVDGKPLFIPTRFACFAVAGALGLASLLLLSRGGFVSTPLPASWIQAGTVGVGVVFVLRAVGDFRVVGFFKRVCGTPFAVWDTRLFSPLCLGIGLASLWVALAT